MVPLADPVNCCLARPNARDTQVKGARALPLLDVSRLCSIVAQHPVFELQPLGPPVPFDERHSRFRSARA